MKRNKDGVTFCSQEIDIQKLIIPHETNHFQITTQGQENETSWNYISMFAIDSEGKQIKLPQQKDNDVSIFYEEGTLQVFSHLGRLDITQILQWIPSPKGSPRAWVTVWEQKL